MSDSRIKAIATVNLQASPAVAEQVQWFYTQVAGLECIEPTPETPIGDRLRFRSGNTDLVVTLCDPPKIEDNAYRIEIGAPSLRQVRELLAKNRIPYVVMRGLAWTDRRLGVRDPGGNLIYIKQDWPLMTF